MRKFTTIEGEFANITVSKTFTLTSCKKAVNNRKCSEKNFLDPI